MGGRLLEAQHYEDMAHSGWGIGSIFHAQSPMPHALFEFGFG
ncbi:MAG: hypothetical protein V7L05_22635 [Nostoc sp.]